MDISSQIQKIDIRVKQDCNTPTTNITNQGSTSPRVATTKICSFLDTSNKQLIVSSCIQRGESLLHDIPLEIWRTIFFINNSLQTILMFRLISKHFEVLICKIKILKEKATLVIDIKSYSGREQPLHEDVLSKYQREVNFSKKEDLTVNYRSSFYVCNLQDLSIKFQDVLKIILDIKDCSEMQLLQEFIQKGAYIHLLNKVQKLNFCRINEYGPHYKYESSIIDSLTLGLMTEIESNIHYFPNLVGINLTEHVDKQIAKFPKIVNQLTKLFYPSRDTIKAINAPNLEYLEVQNLSLTEGNNNCTIKLNNLLDLKINGIDTGKKYDFFNNVEYLTASLNLVLPNLQRLQIGKNLEGYKWDCVGFNLNLSQSKLPNLDELKIGTVTKQSSLLFPSFPNLRYLLICECYEYCNVKFEELSKLEILEIGYMGKNSTCQLPNSLNSLTRLVLVGLDSTTNFRLPTTLPNLQYLELRSLNEAIIEKLPNFLPKVEDLCIQGPDYRVLCSGKINFSLSYDNLENLTIPNLAENTVLNFCGSMNNLKTLRIGNFGENAKIIISKTLPNLENLILGDMAGSNSISINLSESCPKLLNLAFGNINDRECKINILGSKNNLQSLTFGSIKSTYYSPSVFSKAFNIVQLPKALNKLSKLQIDNYSDDAKLYLPDSLPNLTEFIFGGISLTYCSDKKQFLPLKEDYPTYDVASKLKRSGLLYAINKRINMPPSPEEDENEKCSCQ